MPDTGAVDRAEELAGPSEGCERPEDVPTDEDDHQAAISIHNDCRGIPLDEQPESFPFL